MGKVTRQRRKARGFLRACVSGDLMVLNGKLWLSMFWDKKQTFGGWGWVAEEQEGGYARTQKQGVFPGRLRLIALL